MTDTWALRQAFLTLERARRLTRQRGQPPTRWALTLLWLTGEKEVYSLPAARNLTTLVRRAREIRSLRQPTWLYAAGRLVYRSGDQLLPHIVVVLAGEERCAMLYAEVDSDGNPGPPQVKFDPDPNLLGPLARLGR